MRKLFQIKFDLLVLLLLCFYTSLSAQVSDNFNDLIEKTQDGKVKIYFNGTFQIAYKECAEYYLIVALDDKLFQFKDSVKVFYSDHTLFLTGFYKDGKLNGKFNSFYKDGMKQMAFEYSNGDRTGIWESFSRKGQSIKKVSYKNNTEFLLEQRNEQGDYLVEHGEGKFVDSLFMSTSSTQKSKVTGNVKSGLPDGEWNFSAANTNYAKEFFEDFTFVKGISISKVIGDELYFDHYNATFSGIIFLERLRIISPTRCKEKSEFVVDDEFYGKLKKQFYKQKLNELILDAWFFVEIQTGANKKIIGVSIISKAGDESIGLIKDLIFSVKEVSTLPFKYKPGFRFFPIVIKNSKIITGYDKDIDLLSIRF